MRYITTGRNVKLAVYDTNPGGGQTVLLVHGWPLSHEIFEYQQMLLARQGYRVVTLDLRGFGASDAPWEPYGYDQMADDLYAVVRILGISGFVLAGFSMGGAIALRYMRRHRGFGVCKLALLGAAAPCYTRRPGFSHGVEPQAVNALLCQAQIDRPQFCRNFSQKLLASPHSQAMEDWFCGISLSASMVGTVKAGCALRDEDGRPDLRSVKVPTGIFHGMRDEIVPYDLALVQKEAISDATLFPFSQSGHAVFYDELENFNEKFSLFLKHW